MLPLDITPEAIGSAIAAWTGSTATHGSRSIRRPTAPKWSTINCAASAEHVPAWTSWNDPRGGTRRPDCAGRIPGRAQPGESRSITLEVTPTRPRPNGRAATAWTPSWVSTTRTKRGGQLDVVETDHEQFNRLLSRALQDLRLLMDDVDGNLVPTAGIPWFAVPFGRDSLITSMQSLSVRPDIARGTLRFLASLQGTEINDFRDEEPGKILHEVRRGELSQLGRVPHTRYSGSIDSTPLFLIALGESVNWTADLDAMSVVELNTCYEVLCGLRLEENYTVVECSPTTGFAARA
jgi:hypothetical protein